MQKRKHVCYHSETFSQVVVNYRTYDKELYGSKREQVEAIFDWQGDHHSHRSPTLVVPPVANQASTSMSFQMDGIPPTILLGNKKQEGNLQQSGRYAFSPSYFYIYSFSKCFFIF